VAWRAFEDHPINGVGLSNYSEVAPDYTRQPGALERVTKVTENSDVVHNMYLHVLTELGVIGFGLLMFVILASLRAAWLAGRRAEELGNTELEALSRAILVGTLGMLAASTFISDQVDRRLWILLALGPAALAVVSRAGSGADQPASYAPTSAAPVRERRS